jgi:(E)-4-hydroxy-3-methylbut-2-enyl-diphosphate synthase
MTRKVFVKDVPIGGGSPIAIQSMTITVPSDVKGTIDQIERLKAAGCHIVRIAVPDLEEAKFVGEIIRRTDMPIVADIHFDYRIAIECIKSGIHKIRFNPGNIGSRRNVEYLVKCAKEHGVPIRVGVNSGSIEKEFADRPFTAAQKLCESALKHVRLLEEFSFYDTVISVKSSSVITTIEAYEYISKLADYPLHVGVTEAGPYEFAIVKSAIGIGALLAKGIGDTIRVSITGDPVREVKAAQNILKALGKMPHPEIVSCPSCGRCNYDLEGFVGKVQKMLEGVDKDIKVAIMGCVVNGPGEAKDADIGIAGGSGRAAIFKKGRVVKSVSQKQALDEFIKELKSLL